MTTTQTATTPVPGNLAGQLLFALRQWSEAARATRAEI